MEVTGLWCLFDQSTGKVYSGLTLDEVRAILMVVPLSSQFDWQVWHDSWMEWQEVIAVAEVLAAPNRKMAIEPPTPVANTPAPKGTKAAKAPKIPGVVESPTMRVLSLDSDVELNVEGQKAEFMTREHPRLRKRYRVVIEKDANRFESHTLNISEGGMHLENPLPDWVIGYCEVKVTRIDTKNSIDLTFAVVENQEPNNRIRLQVVEDKNQSLRQWLLAA